MKHLPFLDCAIANRTKLRERLEKEKLSQAANSTSLQSEINLIGDELSTIKLHPTKAPGTPIGSASLPRTNTPGSSASIAALLLRIQGLEEKVSSMNTEMATRASALSKDVETSLLVSERRAKKLDDLYKEASAENEALYERFNTELSKLAKTVRSGEGVNALQTSLKDALEEVARVKKENLRLRREVGGLRAVVGGHRQYSGGSASGATGAAGRSSGGSISGVVGLGEGSAMANTARNASVDGGGMPSISSLPTPVLLPGRKGSLC